MRRRPVIAGRHTKTNPPLTQLPQAPSSNTEDAAIDTESIPNEHDDNSLEPVTESDDDSDSLSLVDDKEIPDEQRNAPPPVLTRSGRQVKAPKQLIETCIASSQQRRKGFKSESKYDYGRGIKDKVASKTLNNQFLMALKWSRVIDLLRSHDLSAMNAWMERHTDVDHDTVEEWHPLALAAQANGTDNPTWEEAMNGPDKAGYWKACEDEIETLENKACWDIVDRENWMNVLPGTWAFRCKRFPDGTIRKLKARFCARGDRQIEGVDFFETFAPVTNWMTVRLMLTLSMILGLHTKQVDYTAAFIHAPIDGEVFVQMPRGFTQQGKCLRLKKSIYGLRQSPRNFFQHLKGKLENAGLQIQSGFRPVPIYLRQGNLVGIC